MPDRRTASSGRLRAELVQRHATRGAALEHEVSYTTAGNVVYGHDEEGGHANFLKASYRRILADPAWARRLEKSYTGSRLLPRAADRWRGELECLTSSDALLMNVFCYPGVLRRPVVCALLGVDPGLRPEFGVRAELAMRNGEIDRTEFDMKLGPTLAEAKLTETGFGRASRDRLLRYLDVEAVFEPEALPRAGTAFTGYQLVRGLLAALQTDGTYLVLLDGRRADLLEIGFAVLQAVRSTEDRFRMRFRTWQELAAGLPPVLQAFLEEKYGIVPA